MHEGMISQAEISASNVAVVLGRGSKPDAIDREEALRLMHEHGAVLFRGFLMNPAAFVSLTDRFCYHFLEHASLELRPRRSGDGTVAEVVVGNNPVSLHGEMYYTPTP